MLNHGGQLRQAAHHYNIPLENWTDLSTGINPNGYPVPEIPASCWQRLPENDDGLLMAARNYYQCETLLAVAGSQAAIQALPSLFPRGKVGVLHPSYAEHEYCWHKAGHQIVRLTEDSIERHLAELQVLIAINPNNPTAVLHSPEKLLEWHRGLQLHGGTLIVDEAFMDCTPEHSLLAHSPMAGLMVLRSIGKFFGLAGIRCGFVSGEESLLARLEEILGAWPLSHPGRYVASRALSDEDWQRQMRKALKRQSQRLQTLLDSSGLAVTGDNALFQWVKAPEAASLYQQFAKKGVLTRLFAEPCSLRFGLPKNEEQWRRLEEILVLD